MTRIHHIRLRGPWEVSALETFSGTSRPQRTKMQCPCSWREGGWPGFKGRASHIRRFGQPTQLGTHERVWLVIEPCNADLTVALNEKSLGRAPKGRTFEWDITDLIAQRNTLTIELSGEKDTFGLTGEVRLEIRSEADEDSKT